MWSSNKKINVSHASLVNSLRCLDTFCNASVVNNGILVELNNSLQTIHQHMSSVNETEFQHKNIMFVLQDDQLCIRLIKQSHNN